MAQKGRVGKITATAPPAEKEFQGSGVEGTKAAAESPKEPTVITCDDVLKNLRAQGHDV